GLFRTIPRCHCFEWIQQTCFANLPNPSGPWQDGCHVEGPARRPGTPQLTWLRARGLATALSGSLGEVPNPRWGVDSLGLVAPLQDRSGGPMGAGPAGAMAA